MKNVPSLVINESAHSLKVNEKERMHSLKDLSLRMCGSRSYDLECHTQVGNVKEGNSKGRKLSCFGCRHVVSFMGFLFCVMLSGQRMAFCVVIVAMVNHTQGTLDLNTTQLKSYSVNSSAPEKITHLAGEFNWDSQLQGYILGAGFLGYILTNFLAGRVSEVWGAKWTLFYGVFFSSLFTLVSPFAARWNVNAFIAVLFARGLAQGFTVPPVFVLMANWFPRSERGLLSSFVMSGLCFGPVAAGWIAGKLSDVPQLGWPSVFYTIGGFGVVVGFIFIFIIHEVPQSHPYISHEELKYITEGQENDMSKKRPPVPWKKVFTSVPVYAAAIGMFGYNWAGIYFKTAHPTYMGIVVNYSMEENGATSSLSFLFMTIGTFLATFVSNKLTNKAFVSVDTVRKSCTSLYVLGFSACLVGVVLAGCDKAINVVCFSIATLFVGVGTPGIMIVIGDMTPTFAGSLVGISTTFSSVSSAMLPVIVGAMTKQETLKEWHNVFFMHIAVVLFTGLVFQIFGSAEVQSWNFPESEGQAENDTTLTVPSSFHTLENHSSTHI